MVRKLSTDHKREVKDGVRDMDEDDLEAPVARCRAATYDLEAANTAVATTALRKASSAARPVARPMASALATSPPPPSLAWNPPPRVVRSATPSRPLQPTATPLGVGARPPQGSVLKSALRPSTGTLPEDDDTAGKSGRRRLERGAVVLAVFLPLRLWYGARQEQRRLIRRHLQPRAAHARPVQSRHRTAAEHA